MYRVVSASCRISACLPRPDIASSAPSFARCFAAAAAAGKPFAERDIVILRHKSDPSAAPILSKPLAPEAKIQTHKGALSHADIIGKQARDVVKSSSGAEFRIHQVSLTDYVRLSKRLVTPIYPADANLIVGLLDLHVSPPSAQPQSEEEPQLEILEAGTGHGSLTLHLSRAIHAANSSPPSLDLDRLPEADATEPSNEEGINVVDSDVKAKDQSLEAWKATRRAVLHTIDVSEKYSKHARKVVRGFRHGLYASNVDFHVGDVSDWVKQERSRRATQAPFLTHAFLDLPMTHTHLSTVASALRTDGTLIVFNPSITQIADCMQRIKQDNLPLYLDQTLELGTNGTSGGREWDVRAVKPRASIKKESEAETLPSEGEATARDTEQVLNDAETNSWTLVCRPKVGERVVGGGFLGVFKKMEGNFE